MHVAPRRFGRGRLAAFRGVERLARALGGRAWYRARHLRRGRLLVREERVRVPRHAAALDGLRIAQLSDVHAGPFLGPGDLDAVWEVLAGARPDLVALTGDFCVHSVDEALPMVDELAAYPAPLGTFLVFGNHDYKERREHELAARFEARGVHVLRNACVRVPVGDAVLAVTGLEDLEEGKVVDLAAARADLRPRDVEVMLCHNPRGGPALAREGCAVVLSGHSHGGQVDLPLLRRLGPPHPGQRVELGPTTLIVSRGLGAVGIPVRFRAPAEVVLVNLECGDGAHASGAET